MKEYNDYQTKLKDLEREENGSGETIEQHVPALFVLVFAFISGAATFYLNEAGMRNSPLYDRTIGSGNAAFLVLFILEGSFLTLTLLGHRVLKSQPQRKIGKQAIGALKIVLSLNILVTFVMLAGADMRIMPAVRLYAQWGFEQLRKILHFVVDNDNDFIPIKLSEWAKLQGITYKTAWK